MDACKYIPRDSEGADSNCYNVCAGGTIHSHQHQQHSNHRYMRCAQPHTNTCKFQYYLLAEASSTKAYKSTSAVENLNGSTSASPSFTNAGCVGHTFRKGMMRRRREGAVTCTHTSTYIAS